jgi:hypothetical protein
MKITRDMHVLRGAWLIVLATLLWIVPVRAQENATEAFNDTENATLIEEESGARVSAAVKVSLVFDRNPFFAPEAPDAGNATVADPMDDTPRVIGGKDEVQWRVRPGTTVPSIRITGMMRAEKGVAACAVVAGLGPVILRPAQKIMIADGKLSWFEVREINGREMTIVLEQGEIVRGTFF